MNPHELLNAVNDIDDDLLEEVNAVRNAPKKRRILPLACRIGAAACLCLLIGIGAYHAFAPAPVADEGDLDGPVVYGSAENGASGGTPDLYTGALTPEDGAVCEDTADQEPTLRGDEFELYAPLTDVISTDLPDEEYLTVSGEITAWEENGFSLFTADKEELFITVGQKATFSVTNEETATFTNAPPTADDLPVGSAVTVDADPDTLTAKHVSKGE